MGMGMGMVLSVSDDRTGHRRKLERVGRSVDLFFDVPKMGDP